MAWPYNYALESGLENNNIIIKNWQRNSGQKARFGDQWQEGEMLTSYRCGYLRRSCGKRLRWRNVKILPEKSKECEPQGWHFTSGCWSIRNTCSHIEINTARILRKVLEIRRKDFTWIGFPMYCMTGCSILKCAMFIIIIIDNFYYYSQFHKGNDWQWCWQW